MKEEKQDERDHYCILRDTGNENLDSSLLKRGLKRNHNLFLQLDPSFCFYGTQESSSASYFCRRLLLRR